MKCNLRFRYDCSALWFTLLLPQTFSGYQCREAPYTRATALMRSQISCPYSICFPTPKAYIERKRAGVNARTPLDMLSAMPLIVPRLPGVGEMSFMASWAPALDG